MLMHNFIISKLTFQLFVHITKLQIPLKASDIGESEPSDAARHLSVSEANCSCSTG